MLRGARPVGKSTLVPMLLEVKSGATGKPRSLWQYVLEKRSKNMDLSVRKKMSVKHKITTLKSYVEAKKIFQGDRPGVIAHRAAADGC